MCGIAGMLLRGQEARADLVEAMCAQMVHRGPDDSGVMVDRGCGLGMRRLSIIDLCTGRQPISNEDGTVQVVFNGEIYNFDALRALASRPRAPVPDQQRHRGDRPPLRGGGRRGSRKAPRDVRHRHLGRPPRRSCCSPATASGRSRCTTRVNGDGLYFASELQCAAGCGGPGSSSTAKPCVGTSSCSCDPRTRVGLPERPEARARVLAAISAGRQHRVGQVLVHAGARGPVRRRPAAGEPARGVARQVRRSGAHSAGCRRPARGLPQRRHRLRFGRGFNGPADRVAGQDVLDRLQGGGLQRAGSLRRRPRWHIGRTTTRSWSLPTRSISCPASCSISASRLAIARPFPRSSFRSSPHAS